MRLLSTLLLTSLFGWFVSGQAGLAADAWVEDSFEEFSDGTFGDAGANTYVSAKGRIQTVNRFDVNKDSNIDLLAVNSHPLVEMLDMSIYWGNGKDFSIKNHDYVPVNGPMWITPGDLNKDGNTDLVIANYSNGTWTQMDSAIYWGGLEPSDQPKKDSEWAFFPFKSRSHLPSQNCQKAVVGDFNKDGWDDIVFAFAGGFWEYRGPDAKGAPSRIYWNQEGSFDPERFTDLTTLGPTDVAASDLDNNGWLDLVFSNADKDSESVIFYGSEAGFSEDRTASLPTVSPHAVEIADINNDGSPDILFANEAGSVSYGYLNEGGQFDSSRRVEFKTFAAKDCVVADFNKDGFADVFFTNHQSAFDGEKNLANRLIKSFLYFGSEQGFSEENLQKLPTIGAWGANAADLNEDGWVDLLVCNFQEHYSYEVPSFIYWNGPDGFEQTKRTPLYEHGAQGNAIADFNGDGHLDIAMTSMMGRSRGDYDPCFLYIGNDQGTYSVENRVELPGREAYEQAYADLDDDGQVDILLMNQGEVTRLANELFIYWNEDNQFDPWRVTGLSAYKGLGIQVADLDRDGYIDLIMSNYTPDPSSHKEGIYPGVLVYWGSKAGYVTMDRTSVQVKMSRSPAIVDINGDGHLDLVFGQERPSKKVDAVASVWFGNGTREFSEDRRILLEGAEDTGTPEVADLNQDGYLDIAFAGEELKVFYGDKDAAFKKENSMVFDLKTKTSTIADVNGDGWLDILCPFYKGDAQRSWFSTLLLGGPEGFDIERSIQLPTDGGAGALASDYNFDGLTDVFFWCHRRDGSDDAIGEYGDHYTDSFLYYNGPDGFKEENRLGIPTRGVHYDTGVDIGHIRDRSFTFDYVSSPHQTGGKTPTRLSWEAETPGKTAVRFQIRSAASEQGLADAEWRGPNKNTPEFVSSGTPIEGLTESAWIQYRAVLDTGNGAASPILSKVEIAFE